MKDSTCGSKYYSKHPGEVVVSVRSIEDPIESFAGYWADRIIVIGSITEDIRKVLCARSNTGLIEEIE